MAIAIREGQFFLLPVERGQYAVGLIARAPKRGGGLLGYFFGPRRNIEPSQEWLNARAAQQAVRVCRFKDIALFRGEWKLLDVLPVPTGDRVLELIPRLQAAMSGSGPVTRRVKSLPPVAATSAATVPSPQTSPSQIPRDMAIARRSS